MEVHSRIDHGQGNNNMAYSQRNQNHRPSHNQAPHPQGDIYKPSRSPSSRYTYPQNSQAAPPLQVLHQRYPTQGGAMPTITNPSLMYRDYRPNRISLLHNTEYGPSRGREPLHSVVIEDGGPPIKKIKLTDKEALPLRIETRDQPGTYNPQVEQISPTIPDHVQQEDQAFRTTKDELIQQIGKVDREIAKAESSIAILKKKQQELEEIANKPSVKSEVEEDTQPKHQSLHQKIYAENRKKAQSAHAQLDALGPKVEWPLYNQPSDTAVYHENKRKHVAFKGRLIEYFKKRHAEKESRNSYLTETYSKMMQEWLRKVDKIESSSKKKGKEAKNRDFFEKVFPELRKQREDKERFNRVGSRVKSEADLEEIMDNLQEQAMEDKKMRSYAVIPPILLDAKEKKIKYDNNNGFVVDMESVYKDRKFLNVWTPAEKEVFKEKYLQHPKNFCVVASYLDRKSVADCVQYYYLSKKTENYKRLLRKSRQRTRSSRGNTQKVNHAANQSVVDILTTGVTTRLQREQQAKTVENRTSQAANSNNTDSSDVARSTTPVTSTSSSTTTTSSNSTTVVTTTTNSSTPSTTSPSTTPATLVTASTLTNTSTSTTVTTTSSTATTPPTSTTSTVNNLSSSLVITVVSSTNATSATSSSTSITTATVNTSTANKVENGPDDTKVFNDFNSYEDYRNKNFFNEDGKDKMIDGMKDVKKEGDSATDNASDQNMVGTVTENKKKPVRKKEENVTMETSDEEANANQDKQIQGTCAVCNAQLGPQLQSRPLIPNQAAQYGLREDQIQPNARVCNTCRCKCVRSRYTHCPLPNCPNSRTRVKRLRSFPCRLQDLSSDVKDTILAEFRVPSGVTKCCSACFNRIQRRLGPVEEWSEAEVGDLRSALTDLGANWQLVGERLNKMPVHVKSFYAANRKRLNLENCLGDRKPTLTDEEESGSSTSSCEEPIRERERHSSDTASAAESPPVMSGNSQNQSIKKEDYDSSATETADEAVTPDNYQGTATITPVTVDGQPRQNTSPLSVKDLVLNVIEFQLMKNPGAQPNPQNPPTSGITPTISSILNSNDSADVTIVSEYNLNSQPGGQNPHQNAPRTQRNDLNLAKLVTPLIGATITPVSGPIVQNPTPEPIASSRDDLVVLQVNDSGSVRQEPETLDLSIKKPREPSLQIHPSKHPNQQQLHVSNRQTQEQYNLYHPDRKSPAFPIRSQLPSPKPANPKTGSITLGTPIITQPRYGILRQMPPETKMGSITQGTPIHMPHNSIQDKRVFDHYMKRPSSQGPPQQPTSQQQYPSQQYREPGYSVDQHMSSRQIIMNDYITSQQMLGRRSEKMQYYPNSSHRTPPPPSGQSGQQRQGVIQRHTRPQYLQPGHEALSSLVDVAVQQPSLPVPTAPHEGLGKTIAEQLEQPHRYQIMHQQQQQQLRQQQQQQQQRNEEQRRVEYHRQQQAQQQQPPSREHIMRQGQHAQAPPQNRNESNTLTAASLIDAIITHQINQTVDGNRGEVVSSREQPTRAGDLLFQGFQRNEPMQHQQHQAGENNSENRPPSVVSVDLDSDTVNKNLTVKELTDSVISHDFSTRQGNYSYIQPPDDQWKRRLLQHQHQKEDSKRSNTPQQHMSINDERQIIRIAQPTNIQQAKYHVEPVSPPENNHWNDSNFRRYPTPQPHLSALDYVKNRIVEVMRTEDDKKDTSDGHPQGDKDRDSPGDMVIDEDKNEGDYPNQHSIPQTTQPQTYTYSYLQHKDSDNSRSNEPKPLLSAQYEPLSDED